MTQLAFVTRNEGKFREVSRLLQAHGFEVRMADLNVDEPQSDSMEYVTKKKATSALDLLRSPLFVEDAGLFVPSLNDFPGVYSSYAFSKIGNEGLLKLMEGRHDRRAVFRSMVGFVSPSLHPEVLLFEGEVKGELATSPRGQGGFGFDPIFIPYGSKQTFAEMKTEEKNKLSHRAKSVNSMGSFLSTHLELVR